MHPDLLESLVRDRITELRGGRNRRWPSTGRARVGRLFVRVGTSLIGEGVVHQVRQPRPAPAGITR